MPGLLLMPYPAVVPVPVPKQVADLLLWLDVDQGITKDGSDRVSLWEDQSGNGFDCSQAVDANKLVWIANQWNGHAVLRGAASRFLQGALVWNYTKATLFVVSAQTGALNDGGLFDSTDTGQTNRALMLLQESGQRIARASGAVLQANYTFSSTARTVHVVRSDGIDPINGTCKLYDKTVEKASSAIAAVSLSVINYRICRLFENVYPFVGDVAEYILYSRQLTAPEITLVSDYLVDKYAVP